MTVDPGSDRAMFRQLADLLRDQITTGKLRPGALIPSEPRLVQQHGIGRDTVRRAMAVLRGEGLVTTEQGTGTWVRQTPSRTVTIRIQGDDWVEVRLPSDIERRKLGLDEGIPVFEVHRANGELEIHPADRARIVTG
jgi:DNA-binding GntR family transcriptional regulator